MIRKRPASERGHANYGWLDTYHTFSFGRYHDPEHTGFRSLRVLNDDTVIPGRGFGEHGHADMEIVTYVVDGALEHRDSTGATSVLPAGGVQRMTAGSGITHSEYNHSSSEPLRFLQIWIEPATAGLAPGHEEAVFPVEERAGILRPLVAPDRRDGALTIAQDCVIYGCVLAPGDAVRHEIADRRHAWIQVVEGNIDVEGVALQRGDGAAVSDETVLEIAARRPSDLLVFDLA